MKTASDARREELKAEADKSADAPAEPPKEAVSDVPSSRLAVEKSISHSSREQIKQFIEEKSRSRSSRNKKTVNKESLDSILKYIYKLKQAASQNRKGDAKDEELKSTDQVAELVERISTSQDKTMRDQCRRAQQLQTVNVVKGKDVEVASTTAQAGARKADGIDSPQKTDAVTSSAAAGQSSSRRKRREIFKCPHTDRKHYAKNMCHNCYHRKGKTKMAYACGHVDKSHYSNGMCQNCYLAKYYIKRK